MPINDEVIRISVDLPRETYIRLRDQAHRLEKAKVDIVRSGLEIELEKIERSAATTRVPDVRRPR